MPIEKSVSDARGSLAPARRADSVPSHIPGLSEKKTMTSFLASLPPESRREVLYAVILAVATIFLMALILIAERRKR
jgi:hypothetical protein